PRLCSDNRPLQYSELDTAFVRCMERDTRGLSVKGAAAGLQYLGGFKNDVRVLQGVAGPDQSYRLGHAALEFYVRLVVELYSLKGISEAAEGWGRICLAEFFGHEGFAYDKVHPD